MAKIVIIAPSDVDVTDAVKLLKNGGNDVDVEAPEAKSILHIVLGLFGQNAYGFGPDYVVGPAAGPAPDDGSGPPPPSDDETATEDDATSDDAADDAAADIGGSPDDTTMPDGGDDDFNFEGATVDGEPIECSITDLDHSVLIVEKLVLGPKTTYMLNESTYSFWPADQNAPMQRVDVGRENVHTSIEVAITQGDKQELKVGKDLQAIFECPCEDNMDVDAPVKKRVAKKKKVKEEVDAPDKVKDPVKATSKEPEPVYRPGGATVVILNDPYTPGEVVVQAIVASTNLSPSEAMKRVLKAHKGGWSPIASYASKDTAETVADKIMRHARANKDYDFYRAHPHFKNLKGPWPLTAEVMDADSAGGK